MSSGGKPLEYITHDLKTREGIAGFTKRTFPKVGFGLSPLWAFFGAWTVACGYSIYHAFMKNDVQINRSATVAPWEWQRSKDSYERRQRILFDSSGSPMWKRIPELDAVMEEMVAEEKKL